MLMVIPVGLILAGIFMLVRLILFSRRPRVEAVIEEIIEEEKNWYSKKTSKIVSLTFTYESELFVKKRSYLIASTAKVGDKIPVSINPRKPQDFTPYKHKIELIWAIFTLTLGFGILYSFLFLIDLLAK